MMLSRGVEATEAADGFSPFANQVFTAAPRPD